LRGRPAGLRAALKASRSSRRITKSRPIFSAGRLVGSDRDQHVVLHAAKSTQLTTTVIDYHGCMPCVVMVQCNRGHVFIQEVPCLSTPTADVDARLRQRIPSERSGHVRFASSRCLRPMHGCTLALGSFTRNATTGRPCHQGDLSRKRIASPLSKKNDSTKEAPSTIRRDVPRGSDRRSSSTGELHRRTRTAPSFPRAAGACTSSASSRLRRRPSLMTRVRAPSGSSTCTPNWSRRCRRASSSSSTATPTSCFAIPR
jgi:hypothetical protein